VFEIGEQLLLEGGGSSRNRKGVAEVADVVLAGGRRQTLDARLETRSIENVRVRR
jgi:hypothetical protein